jgi:high-affinity iron transporter
LTSYLEGFELAEASLDAVDCTLRQEIEAQMIAYRDALRRGLPAEEIARLAGRIDGLLEASAEKLGGEGLSPTTAAVSAFFILVREGLEALLVVAAIVAFLIKAGRREARNWQRLIDRHMKDALQAGTLWALAGLSFVAVYREAFETVLFYQALWQQAGAGAHGSILVGFASGVAVLALVAWLILRYRVRLPIGPFFAACSVLMAVLAIVFTGHGVKALQEAGALAASPVGSFGVPALGVYPTLESLSAQTIVFALVLGAYFFTRKESQ